MLQRARRDGCPWDDKTSLTAASRGKLDMLKWAVENGCPWNEQDCCLAALTGTDFYTVLVWALRCQPKKSWKDYIQWLMEHKGITYHQCSGEDMIEWSNDGHDYHLDPPNGNGHHLDIISWIESGGI
jgi:hypothetical protein